MRIQMIETAQTASGCLSIGAFYVKCGLERAGHQVDIHSAPQQGYDCECISVHHVTDFERVVNMPKHSPIRVLGGHAFYSNPRPLIPFADYICLGEWDSGLENFEGLPRMESVITCSTWRIGQSLPTYRIETQLPPLRPYLNHDDTKSAAYYIEIARGCPFACHYCELGHSIPYRRRSLQEITQAIDMCDLTVTRKINLFAPDESSHPDYDAILDYMQARGAFPSGFASMRVDTVNHLHHLRKNTLIRCGIDGLTEATRYRVGKKISDAMIIDHFRRLTEAGHTNFKMFMMFGYPWETVVDFNAFERVMSRVCALDLKKNISLRIKWTPLIPQPNTPLSAATPQYDSELVSRIERWHLLHAKPKRTPGVFIENDGLMSQKTHQTQCKLTTAKEDYFL